jgi:hypothetical protein
MMKVMKDISMQGGELKNMELEEKRDAKERTVAVKEMTKRVEHGKRTMFMEPSALHEEGQAYRELWPDDLGIKRLLSKQWLQWYRYHLRVNIDAVSICGLIKAPMMN